MSGWIKYDDCPHPYCVEGSVTRYDKQTTESYGQVIVELSEVTEQCPVCKLHHELEQARANTPHYTGFTLFGVQLYSRDPVSREWQESVKAVLRNLDGLGWEGSF